MREIERAPRPLQSPDAMFFGNVTRALTLLAGCALGALLWLSPTQALACACCDGWSVRRVIGWSARGAALVDYRVNMACEEHHALEIWRSAAARPIACFDMLGEDPNARVDCGSLASRYDQDEALANMAPAQRIRRTSRRRFFPLPAKRIHADHVRAALRPIPSSPDALGPEALLLVAIRTTNGNFEEVLRRRVTYHSRDDPSGESPQALNGIEVAVFPSPDASRAVVRFGGHDVAPGTGHFPDELRFVTLPALAQGALVDSAPNIAALLPPSAGVVATSAPQARAWLNRAGLRAHRRGEFHQSARLFADAIMHQPSAAMPRFNLACASARIGARDQALWLLEELASRADECEQCREVLRRARTDEDLASVRSDARFVAAVARGGSAPSTETDSADMN